MRCRRKIVWLIAAFICCSGAAVSAQDEDKPLALLRQRSATGEYFIRVQTNAKPPATAKLSAILTNKSELVSWEEEVKDCPLATAGKFCQEHEGDGSLTINFPLARRPQAADKLKVSFAISDSAGRGSFRSVDVIPDFKVAGPRLDDLCQNGLVVDVQADNPTLDTNAAERTYYSARLAELDKWLRSQKSDPARIAKVRIEPLTRANVSEYAISTFSVSPASDEQAGKQDLDVARALGFQKASVCVRFEEKLPAEKFNAEVAFQNSPPMELEKSLVKAITGPGPMGSPTASKIPDENKLGLRSLENNLDLGFLFTSSVKELKSNNQTVRDRQSRGSLDLRFAPSLRGRGRPPEVKKWQPFWTPLFLDAKVSTGKISEDTLSLNRVLIGTEVVCRYYEGTERGNRDKYLLTLRATNASDRDFKRAEAKGELEFRPLFESLNQPLKIRRRPVGSVLIPDSPPKEVPSGGFFGYQIQPFVGVEAGRIYRRSRSAFKGEDQSDTVRRLLFGVNMVFNLSPRLTLTLADTFYVRGETPGDRGRNYFNGVAEVPLGNLSRNAAQSIFFSFERGSQPPFATPHVNALKFGYRVRSDFFDRGGAR